MVPMVSHNAVPYRGLRNTTATSASHPVAVIDQLLSFASSRHVVNLLAFFVPL
jgi:hypothetical protein